MISEGEAKENKKEALKKIVEEKIKEDHFIESIKDFQEELKREHQLQLKKSFIRAVMREELGMRYKKVKPIAWTANS